MPGLLHPTVKRSDARWRLSVNEVARAASDADAIRCTGGCLDAREVAPGPTAIRWQAVDAQVAAPDRDEVRCTGDCLIVRLLHPTVKRSDARWRLSIAKAR